MISLLQFTMKFNDTERTQQEVTSDLNDNSVQYHVVKSGQDVWVVNDFGRVRQQLSVSFYLSDIEFEVHVSNFIVYKYIFISVSLF